MHEWVSPDSPYHMRMFSELTNLDETMKAFDKPLIEEEKLLDLNNERFKGRRNREIKEPNTYRNRTNLSNR